MSVTLKFNVIKASFFLQYVNSGGILFDCTTQYKLLFCKYSDWLSNITWAKIVGAHNTLEAEFFSFDSFT